MSLIKLVVYLLVDKYYYLMSAETILLDKAKQSIINKYNIDIQDSLVQIQKTRKEFEGDFTLVTFPLLKISKKSPEQTADELGKQLLNDHPLIIHSYNVIKGFLNIKLHYSFWNTSLIHSMKSDFGRLPKSGKHIVLEFSSPNTNKPLHLGHIRNNFLGWSVSQILEACGHMVTKVNLVNDRGVHICKSMIAWLKFGNGATPQSTGTKGDHFVGDYYVIFDKEYRKQILELTNKGVDAKQAEKSAPIMLEAQEMLRKWENRDPKTLELWERMNSWVYDGFDETYKKLGISFDKIYYESDTYLLGKKIVNEGLEKDIFKKQPDGSVWIDLSQDGLDEKLLLRADGTSVYMTQDLGTAEERFAEYKFDNMVYVVGNEQNYHFQVLKLILGKLGNDWSEKIFHLSYGMVELPEGKMKSREGTVVDADDLIKEMIITAQEMSDELGKLNEMTQEEAERTVNMIGMGALKYFILKVDPKKNMLFDPKETIDFNGNTGPFIQYTHARIKSVLRRASNIDFVIQENTPLDNKELDLIKLIEDYPSTISQAGANYSPALLANYVYELAKEYNQFYHDHPILKEEDLDKRNLRLGISTATAHVIASGMKLLGINVPEKM